MNIYLKTFLKTIFFIVFLQTSSHAYNYYKYPQNDLDNDVCNKIYEELDLGLYWICISVGSTLTPQGPGRV